MHDQRSQRHRMHPGHGGPSRSEYTQIGQLQPSMNTVNVYCIVLETGPVIRPQNGDILQTLRVADQSGSVNLTVRGEYVECFRPSDILKLKTGFTSIHKGCLTLNSGRSSELLRVGEFFMPYNEHPAMSTFNSEFAAIERARKGSPPEDGEVSSMPTGSGPGQFNDPRRNRGGPPKRPYSGGPGGGR